MTAALVICASLALVTAVVHAWLGGREVLRPVLAADLRGLVHGTMEAAWHLLTWHFVVLAGIFGYGAQKGGSAATLAALFGGMNALGFAGIFLAVGLRRFRSALRLPQWTLFLPMGFLALAAPWLGVLCVPRAGEVAAAIASFALAAIGLLHVAWALGSTWPAANTSELAGLVVGIERGNAAGRGMPGRWLTLGVALGLVAAAAWVLGLRGLVTLPISGAAGKSVAWVLVVVFALRGLGGFFEPALRPSIRKTPYLRWNARLYSPIAVGLAVAIGIATAAPV